MNENDIKKLENSIQNWWTKKLSLPKNFFDFDEKMFINIGLNEIIDRIYIQFINPLIEKMIVDDFYIDHEKVKEDNKELCQYLSLYNDFYNAFKDTLDNKEIKETYYDIDKITELWILEIPYDKRNPFADCCNDGYLRNLCWKIGSTQICPVCNKYNFDDDYDICPYCGWENEGFYYGSGANDKPLEEYRKEYLKNMNKNPKYRWDRGFKKFAKY